MSWFWTCWFATRIIINDLDPHFNVTFIGQALTLQNCEEKILITRFRSRETCSLWTFAGPEKRVASLLYVLIYMWWCSTITARQFGRSELPGKRNNYRFQNPLHLSIINYDLIDNPMDPEQQDCNYLYGFCSLTDIWLLNYVMIKVRTVLQFKAETDTEGHFTFCVYSRSEISFTFMSSKHHFKHLHTSFRCFTNGSFSIQTRCQ